MATKPTDDELFNMLKKAYSGSGANIGPRAPLSDEMLRRIQKSVDSANKSSQKKKTGGSVRGMKEGGAVEDPLGDFAKKKVAESDARVNKSRSMTPTKKDPIVTMDAVKKAGFTNLRDYLNDKKGLTRRDGKAPERTKEYMAKNMTAPMQGPAVKANPMGDAARDRAVINDESRKRVSAPFTKRELDGPSDAEVKRAKAMTAKAQEEKYGSGLKMGGKVKGYMGGGSVKGYGKARGAKACKIR